MNDVYICHTLYHVYITILKAFIGRANDDIVLVDYIPDVTVLAKKLSESGIFNKVLVLQHDKVFSKKTRKSFHFNYCYCCFRIRRLKRELQYLDFYNEIYIFNDYSDVGAYLIIRRKKYHVIEDGLDVFKQFDVYQMLGKAKLIKTVLFKLFQIPYTTAISNYCIDIEINDNHDLKTKLWFPVIVIPRDSLTSRLSHEQITSLMRIFDTEDLDLKEKGPKILILMQLLNELECGIAKENQTDYYEQLVKQYNRNYKVFLKPHPRDKTDYSFLVKRYNVIMINKNIPVELLNYMPSVHFDVIVTYSSTAANSLKIGDNIVRLDTNLFGGNIEYKKNH